MNMDHETIVLRTIVTVVGEWGRKNNQMCLLSANTTTPVIYARTYIDCQYTMCIVTGNTSYALWDNCHRYIQVLDKWIGH